MKIQICSDLHLELAKNREWLKNNPLLPIGDVLLIAGDTYYLGRDFSNLDFIKEAANNFKKVYLIPGNHEYYGGYDISTALGSINERISSNVFMVNNTVVEISGIKLIFSTMWSKIQRNILEVMRGMTDFKKIRFKNQRFNINHFNELHDYALSFLSEEVKKYGKKIIISHHLPSLECNAEEHKSSVLNEAFCVDLNQFILNHSIDFWIYGHNHRNLGDFQIGNTKMITNQLGYVDWNEHYSFNRGKVIEIKSN